MSGAVTAPLVELRGVGLAYGTGAERMQALADATLDIAKGEFIAVVGPSGCGKSTLMKLVTGLLPPTSGEIRVHGETVRGPIRGVGMAFQAPTLMPWRTTRDNIMLPLEVVEPHKRRFRSNRDEYIAKAEALLASVGLGGFGDKYPWQLSGGMMQRANLCRALIHDPDLLLLDEPFGALDQFTREELWAIMQDLWLSKKLTVLLVTHDLKEAAYLANRICVMSARPGRILDDSLVAMPRPRTIEMTFEPDFVALNQRLRAMIVGARGGTGIVNHAPSLPEGAA